MRWVLALAVLLHAAVGAQAWARGTVETSRFESPSLGVAKNFRIYLPDGYAASTARYPVIYLIHGWGVTERACTDVDGLGESADEMNLQAIVVMPDGDRGMYVNGHTPAAYETCLADKAPTKNRRETREEYCVRTPLYEDYIVKDLIAHIDATYRSMARREGRAITGESMDGFGATMLAFRHPDLFASVAAHSGIVVPLYPVPQPYVRGQTKPISQQELSESPYLTEQRQILGPDLATWREHSPDVLAERLKNGQIAIYLDCGTEDQFGFLNQALYFHDRLNDLGIAHDFQTAPGEHDDKLFRQRIKVSLRFHADQFRKLGTYTAKP